MVTVDRTMEYDWRVGMAISKLLTLREASERTGHRESTYRAWVLSRKVPFYKIGRSVRISETDLEQIINQARVPAARTERHA
jgi:excisionase family DNA binding protein